MEKYQTRFSMKTPGGIMHKDGQSEREEIKENFSLNFFRRLMVRLLFKEKKPLVGYIPAKNENAPYITFTWSDATRLNEFFERISRTFR